MNFILILMVTKIYKSFMFDSKSVPGTAAWVDEGYIHPTQVNAPRPNPSPQVGTHFTYPGGMAG